MIHGFFAFPLRCYKTEKGVKTWFDLTDNPLVDKHYESPCLRDFYLEYSKDLSYEKVSNLLSFQVGNGSLSAQHICNTVGKYAAHVAQEQLSAIEDYESSGYKIEVSTVDIDDCVAEEILYLSDGVCVNTQKPIRDKVPKEGKTRTNLNIMMLQKADKSYQTMLAGKGVGEVKLVQTALYQAYQNRQEKLPMVCISDGARCLKNQNKAIFGKEVVHLLDWYHLQSKIIQLMSQITPNKQVKAEYISILLTSLWEGKIQVALDDLHKIKAKNQLKKQELIGYLEKNKDYIIDYKRRKEAGKTIGTGRVEKQNDCLVAKRQKGRQWFGQKKVQGIWLLSQLTTIFNPKHR